MEIIMAAIVAALGTLGGEVIKDGYGKLKSLIVTKYGENKDLVQAVQHLEEKPNSAGRRETLKEELMSVKADKDEELISVAKVLLEHIKSQPGGAQIVEQTVTGDQNIFSGTGDVNVTK